MVKINIEIDEEVNRALKKYQIMEEIDVKGEAVNRILKEALSKYKPIIEPKKLFLALI